MSKTNVSENLMIEVTNLLDSLTNIFTTKTQQLLEETTVFTGQTLEQIASNSMLKTVDSTIGLDWLMTFLGTANIDKIEATVNRVKQKYPEETSNQIAHRLIVQKTLEGSRLGLITNIIPPVAALCLGIELIATIKLQTDMVYEIAAAYGLDLNDPARRGEVLGIFGLSLGADILKTGLTIVEIVPGIGAVVGASTNAAMLYVLGQTACLFYEGKISQPEMTRNDP